MDAVASPPPDSEHITRAERGPARRSAVRCSWAPFGATAVAVLGALALALTATVPANAVTREVHPSYISKDGLGNVKYDVRFNGTVSSDGPQKWVIDGDFDWYCPDNTITGQSVTFGYSTAGGSWLYKSYWCSDLPTHLHLSGGRQNGEAMKLIVGATSGVFNTYQYGSQVNADIGTD